MAQKTSIDEVANAVAAVKAIQEQLNGLVDAVKTLAARVEAIERIHPHGGGHA